MPMHMQCRPVSPIHSLVVLIDHLVSLTRFWSRRWNATDPDDPYWEGKRMAMYARLALIADEVGLKAEVSRRAEAEAEAAAVVSCMQRNDVEWGGTCRSRIGA